MKIKVRTEQLRTAIKQLQMQNERMQELLGLYEIQFLKIKSAKASGKISQALICRDRMRQELEYNRKLCMALERMVKEYENMEEYALRLQEGELQNDRKAIPETITVEEERGFLEKWNAI